MNKSKPKIEKISFTEDQKREIKDILDGKPSQNLIKYWKDKGMKQRYICKACFKLLYEDEVIVK